MNRVAFVDGENLVIRFQAMVREGATVKSEIAHIPDLFVWDSRPMSLFDSVSRVSYYTSVVGDDAALENAVDSIQSKYAQNFSGVSRRLNARVFKKLKQSNKSRLVDIHITLDALRAAYSHDVAEFVFVTGDGDFLPVIQEIMRHGKRVYVAALSSGLSPDLRRVADGFTLLDDRFFVRP